MNATSGTPAGSSIPNKPRIAIVTHSVVEEDPRVRREAEALLGAGWEVDIFALGSPEPVPSGVPGVRLVHLDVFRHQGAGIATYLGEYLEFLVRAGWALTRDHRHRRYAVVQVAAPPDPLILAGLPVRLAGVPVILDLHEATPEFFRSRFPGAANPLTDRLLHLAERGSIALASAVLSVNEPRHERLLRLGYPAHKLRVVTNGPSLGRFRPEDQPTRPFMADGRLRLVYAGAVTPLYELDVVLRALARLRADRPDLPVVFDVYGRGDAEPGLAALAAELGIADRVVLHGRIPLDDVPAVLAAADVGMSPIQANAFTEISLPTKTLEYAAMGKPAVAADLAVARDQLGSDAVAWYRSGDAASLAAAIGRLVDNPGFREVTAQAAAVRARELSWDNESIGYVELVSAVAERRPLPLRKRDAAVSRRS